MARLWAKVSRSEVSSILKNTFLRESCCLGELVKPKGLRNSLQELGGNLDSELKIIYLFIYFYTSITFVNSL